jgi:putative MATE family efflux protein
MQDLTTGSLARNVLKMSSFMLVSMVFQTLYFLVDLYFVGRLGKSAVAAVSVSGNLTFLVLAATQTLAVGTTSLIAQAVGRRDAAGARLVFNQSQLLSLLVGVLFFVVMMALRGRYAHGLAADPDTARLAGDYLAWFVPAMALQFALVATTAALRGTGNFKPGMIIQSGTVVINMALAPALIFGWGTGHPLGVAGAALASFVAIAVGVLVLIVYVLRGESYLKFVLRDCWPQLALWGRMLKIGLPAGAEFGLMGVYMMVVYSISRPFGAAAQAGFGIGLRVVQALFMPVVALGFAVSPVAGQNFGARLAPRVRETFKVGAAMAIGFMLVFTVACQLFPTAMVRVFSRDPQVLAVGGEYLQIVSLNFVASGLIFVSSSMFQALGNTVPPLLSSTLRIVMLAIPALWLAKLPGFQLRWVWWLAAASTTAQMTANLLLLRREFGRKLNFAAPAPAAAGPAVVSAGFPPGKYPATEVSEP